MAVKVFMGTTKIDPSKTAMEITHVLVASGARQIASDYGPTGKIQALRFVIDIQGQQRAFSLPVRTEHLTKLLRGDKGQAERTAWRQLLRWVEAQFAMIDAGMVKAEEVYAPYMLTAGGQTLFECLAATGFKQLTAGAEDRNV